MFSDTSGVGLAWTSRSFSIEDRLRLPPTLHAKKFEKYFIFWCEIASLVTQTVKSVRVDQS